MSLLVPTIVALAMHMNTPTLHGKTLEGYKTMVINVWHESRGEPVRGMMLVANVTMNRVKSKKFPNTVKKVVYQRKQFSWTHDGKSDEIKVKNKIDAISLLKVATVSALSYTEIIPDQLDGAKFYYNPYKVDPKWARKAEVVAMIGNHLVVKL